MTEPTRKGFDCVAFQRAQRERLSKKFEGMSNDEINAWIRDYRPTDPVLRRIMDRARRGRGPVAPSPRPEEPRSNNP